MKKTTYILALCALFFSCIEPIELETTIDFEEKLVVEAILTDELKQHTIKLSKSFKLEINSKKNPETRAKVSIIDSNGNEYNFSEIEFGTYKSDISFKAEAGNSYTLKIITSANKTYISKAEKITGLAKINDFSAKKEFDNFTNQEGISIYVNTEGLDDNAKYFRYTFKETYKIVVPYWSPDELEIISRQQPYEVKVQPQNGDRKEVCYKTEQSNTIIQFETLSITSQKNDFRVHFLGKQEPKISNRYSIEVAQYVQSTNAYIYYKTLNKISSSQDVFTQNQPGLIPGNIFSSENKNENVIGYFEVASVVKKRLFFNYEDFFPNNLVDYFTDCTLSAPELINPDPLKSTSPLIGALNSGFFIYYKDNNNPDENFKGKYILVPETCGDCTAIRDSKATKPSFWID